MRFQGMGEIYRSDVGQNKNQILGRGRPPPDGRPDPGKRTCREDHALLIVRDEFRAGYSSIGLLASRAATVRRREKNILATDEHGCTPIRIFVFNPCSSVSICGPYFFHGF